MANHASLTGADLHEPKGADTASQYTVYVATGTASGNWQKLTANSIDTSSILNTNKHVLTASLADVSTPSATYLAIPFACRVTQVTSVISGAITGADSIVTVAKTGGFSLGTLTIANSGSAEGTIDSLLPASNNTLSVGDYLKISTDGASSGTASIHFTIEVTLV